MTLSNYSAIEIVKRIDPNKKTILHSNERLRQSFLPKQVRVLFVGESPPALGRFFYRENSGLYRAIHEAFTKAFPNRREQNFLKSFRDLGCYLIDLCDRPVDHLKKKSRRKAHLKGESSLSKSLRTLRPKIIIVVVRSIARNVQRSEHRANWSGQHGELPFLGRWIYYRAEFIRQLVPILRHSFHPQSDKVRVSR